LTSNDRGTIAQVCELCGIRSLAGLRALVARLVVIMAIDLTDAFAYVCVTPDDWILLIVWVCVWVGVH
jgi:hypothetical protein